MTEVERTVAELTRRVQALEDQLAIHNVIVRYGLAADAGDADGAAAVFTDDGVYDVDVGRMDGRPAVRALIDGERHQTMVGRCAHQMGPFVIALEGDRAVATGYSRVYLHAPEATRVYRVSFNRWLLARRGDQWLIERRVTRVLGHEEALSVLRAE
jgi:uncharacterized protein (TIGR02246 family)